MKHPAVILIGLLWGASGCRGGLPAGSGPSGPVTLTGAGAYPISGFSWVVVRRDLPDCETAVPLARYLWWAVHEGQAFSAPLHYAPLPPAVVSRCEAKLRSITCDGKPVLP